MGFVVNLCMANENPMPEEVAGAATLLPISAGCMPMDVADDAVLSAGVAGLLAMLQHEAGDEPGAATAEPMPTGTCIGWPLPPSDTAAKWMDASAMAGWEMNPESACLGRL